MTHIEGGCLCGKVRYSAEAEPVFVGVCHCRDCQRFTGSAFATVVALPASALKLTGMLKTFTKAGDTGKVALSLALLSLYGRETRGRDLRELESSRTISA